MLFLLKVARIGPHPPKHVSSSMINAARQNRYLKYTPKHQTKNERNKQHCAIDDGRKEIEGVVFNRIKYKQKKYILEFENLFME